MKRFGYVIIAGLLVLAYPLVALAEPIQLQLLTNHGPSHKHGQLLAQYVAEYEQQHPGVSIEILVTQPGAMLDRLLVGAAAGTIPDMMHIAGYMLGELAQARIIAPLPDDVITQLSASYLPGALQTTEFEGLLWGYPTEYMPRALVYNQNLFDTVGLPEKAPETWADLREYSIKLTQLFPDGSHDKVGFGLSYSGAGQDGFGMLYSLAYPLGARLLSTDKRTTTVNSPALMETLSFLRELVQGGNALAREWLILDMRAADLAMMVAAGPYWKIEFSAVGREFYEGMRTGPVPVPQQGMTPAAAAYGWLFTVSDTTEHASEAHRFLNWLNTLPLPDGTTRMGNALAHLGSIPVTVDDLRNQETVRDPFMEGFVLAAANGWTFPDPVTPNTPAILRALETAMRAATQGTQSPVNALLQAEREIQSILDNAYRD